jgi:hypothetical protein
MVAVLTHPDQALGRTPDQEKGPFRLIITVKRGVSSDFAATWTRFPSVETARAAAASLARDERVAHIMIVRDEVPPHWVEWAA